MKTGFFLILICFLPALGNGILAQSLTLRSVTSYPFISELTSSDKGSRIAISVNEQGRRNIYVAEGASFEFRKLTSYDEDEGIELTNISISSDGKWVVYVRGGDHGAFDETVLRNPASLVSVPKIEIFSIPFSGGEPVLLAEGDEPQFSPDNKEIVFIKNRQPWRVPVDGSTQATRMFQARGSVSFLQPSPDGKKWLFVSSRGSHSFIGIFSEDKNTLQWIDPVFARDQSPKWSPDGKQIVFVRRPVTGGKPDSLTTQKLAPWSLRIADAQTGKSRQLWEAPRTLQASAPYGQKGFNLHWAAKDRIVFLSFMDGWPHLYSIPASGGQPMLLTPGNFTVEQPVLSPDKNRIVFVVNTGSDKWDYDRRHIAAVSIDKPNMEMLTSGSGIESTPGFINDGKGFAMLSATAKRPTLPAVINFDDKKMNLKGENLIPSDFPASSLVVPESVQFKAPDGQTIYGQIFRSKTMKGKSPAVLFVHGGPRRQMLLGWHYMDYYANTYAINQYLASRGFVVLSVNYRMGVGYGYEFQYPKNTEQYGATEYQDIKAAGEWLASLPDVDKNRIGIYGGSYGGFLTALALGRDSKIFAVGVDISGMHNFMDEVPSRRGEPYPDQDLAEQLARQSSPVSYLDSWTSPVLIISGDDDGNVDFSESIDLIRRFEERGFHYESLVIPDETHHWMKYSNMLKMDEATVDFLERKLGMKRDPSVHK